MAVFSRKKFKDFPLLLISGKDAYKIAVEDEATAFFMRTVFSCPGEKTSIRSKKYLDIKRKTPVWRIELLEKDSTGKAIPCPEWANILSIEVDALSGKVLKRSFYKNISEKEYMEKAFFLKSKLCL